MAGKKKRKKARTKIPIAATSALAVPFILPAPSGRSILDDIVAGNWKDLGYDAREIFLGVGSDGKFRLSWIAKTYGIMAMLGGISMVASKSGINRYFKGLPFKL